jgi:hypothetical protein
VGSFFYRIRLVHIQEQQEETHVFSFGYLLSRHHMKKTQFRGKEIENINSSCHVHGSVSDRSKDLANLALAILAGE